MVEQAPYEVENCYEDVEIRRYPELVLATVDGDDDNSRFGHLFRYIAGDNRARRKIEMTAPVITSETIPMTAPVMSTAGTMSFVMPAGMPADRAPEPLDPEVRIERVPARRVAVVRFKGRAAPGSVEEETALLLCEVGKAGLSPVGKPFLMRYNSPFTPGFLRRNEVGVEVGPSGPA
jgi:hypothetical protein